MWSLSLDRVRQAEPAAEALLNLCAFLAPDLPRDLPTAAPEVLPGDVEAAVTDRLVYNRILAAIGRYSLATVTPTTVGMHRLVRAVILARLDQETERWAGPGSRRSSCGRGFRPRAGKPPPGRSVSDYAPGPRGDRARGTCGRGRRAGRMAARPHIKLPAGAGPVPAGQTPSRTRRHDDRIHARTRRPRGGMGPRPLGGVLSYLGHPKERSTSGLCRSARRHWARTTPTSASGATTSAACCRIWVTCPVPVPSWSGRSRSPRRRWAQITPTSVYGEAASSACSLHRAEGKDLINCCDARR